MNFDSTSKAVKQMMNIYKKLDDDEKIKLSKLEGEQVLLFWRKRISCTLQSYNAWIITRHIYNLIILVVATYIETFLWRILTISCVVTCCVIVVEML